MPKYYRFSDADWESLLHAYADIQEEKQIAERKKLEEYQNIRFAKEVIAPSGGFIPLQENSLTKTEPAEHSPSQSAAPEDSRQAHDPEQPKVSVVSSESAKEPAVKAAQTKNEEKTVPVSKRPQPQPPAKPAPAKPQARTQEPLPKPAKPASYSSKARLNDYTALYRLWDEIACAYGMSTLEFACALRCGMELDDIEKVREAEASIHTKENGEPGSFPAVKNAVKNHECDTSLFEKMAWACAVNGMKAEDDHAFLFTNLTNRKGAEASFRFLLEKRIMDVLKSYYQEYETSLTSDEDALKIVKTVAADLQKRADFENLLSRLQTHAELSKIKTALKQPGYEKLTVALSRILVRYYRGRIRKTGGPGDEQYERLVQAMEQGGVLVWPELFRMERKSGSSFARSDLSSADTLLHSAYKRTVKSFCQEKNLNPKTYLERIYKLEKSGRPLYSPELVSVFRDPDSPLHKEDRIDLFELAKRLHR